MLSPHVRSRQPRFTRPGNRLDPGPLDSSPAGSWALQRLSSRGNWNSMPVSGTSSARGRALPRRGIGTAGVMSCNRSRVVFLPRRGIGTAVVKSRNHSGKYFQAPRGDAWRPVVATWDGKWEHHHTRRFWAMACKSLNHSGKWLVSRVLIIRVSVSRRYALTRDAPSCSRPFHDQCHDSAATSEDQCHDQCHDQRRPVPRPAPRPVHRPIPRPVSSDISSELSIAPTSAPISSDVSILSTHRVNGPNAVLAAPIAVVSPRTGVLSLRLFQAGLCTSDFVSTEVLLVSVWRPSCASEPQWSTATSSVQLLPPIPSAVTYVRPATGWASS